MKMMERLGLSGKAAQYSGIYFVGICLSLFRHSLEDFGGFVKRFMEDMKHGDMVVVMENVDELLHFKTPLKDVVISLSKITVLMILGRFFYPCLCWSPT